MDKVSKFLPLVVRILLGLLFLVSGLNKFLNFMQMPEVPPAAGAFFGAMAATGYLFPLVAITEVVAALMLISGFFVPLGLLLLAPIVVNIALFHFVLTPGDIGVGVFVLIAEAFLGYAYRGAFAGVLAAKSTPSVGGGA